LLKILLPYIQNKDFKFLINVQTNSVKINDWSEELIENYDIMFPLFDKQIEYCHDNFENLDKFIIASKQNFELCNNKVKLNNLLSENGFDIPTMNPEKPPYIIKPIIGAGSFGCKVVYDEIYSISDRDFIQEYISEGVEYSTNVLFNKGILYINTLEFLDEIFDNGVRSFNKNKEAYLQFKEVETSKQVLKFIKDFTDLTKYKGFFNINYKIVNNKFKLFEINPRMSQTGLLDMKNILQSVKGYKC